MGDIGVDVLTTWITKLMDCTPLTEREVKQLCDKAREVRYLLLFTVTAFRCREADPPTDFCMRTL